MKISLGAKTLAQPTPVWVVGTYDSTGQPNIMTAAWGGICCSQPPCVAISLRKATYSYACIAERKAFTINVPSLTHAAAADYVGMVSGRNVDKFAITGLTPKAATKVDAPYVQEFPLVLECALVETLSLGLHTQFVGEIVEVLADKHVLDAQGYPDATKVGSFIFSPMNRVYHAVGEVIGQAFSMGKVYQDQG